MATSTTATLFCPNGQFIHLLLFKHLNNGNGPGGGGGGGTP